MATLRPTDTGQQAQRLHAQVSVRLGGLEGAALITARRLSRRSQVTGTASTKQCGAPKMIPTLASGSTSNRAGPATLTPVCLGSCRLPRPETRSMDFGLSAGTLAAGPVTRAYSLPGTRLEIGWGFTRSRFRLSTGVWFGLRELLQGFGHFSYRGLECLGASDERIERRPCACRRQDRLPALG